MSDKPNERVIELIKAKKEIEFEYAKPVLQHPLPESEAELRSEVRRAITQYLTDEEIQAMQEQKQEVYTAIHKRHMGFYDDR